VIKQPDGLYAVFSTGTDRWVAWDLTREQYIERRAEEAAREARADAARLLDEIEGGRYMTVYGMTFEEANAQSVESGGEDLSRKMVDPQFREQATAFMDQNDELLRRLADDLPAETEARDGE
jgi:hypothetical protein